jgi:hypothetical protein
MKYYKSKKMMKGGSRQDIALDKETGKYYMVANFSEEVEPGDEDKIDVTLIEIFNEDLEKSVPKIIKLDEYIKNYTLKPFNYATIKKILQKYKLLFLPTDVKIIKEDKKTIVKQNEQDILDNLFSSIDYKPEYWSNFHSQFNLAYLYDNEMNKSRYIFKDSIENNNNLFKILVPKSFDDEDNKFYHTILFIHYKEKEDKIVYVFQKIQDWYYFYFIIIEFYVAMNDINKKQFPINDYLPAHQWEESIHQDIDKFMKILNDKKIQSFILTKSLNKNKVISDSKIPDDIYNRIYELIK